MNFLIKLKNIFAFRYICEKVFYLLLINIIVIYALTKNNYYLLLFVIILYIIFLKYNNKLLLFSLIMMMIILLNYFIRVTNFNKFTSLEYAGYTEVYKTVEYDDYQKIYIKTKQGKLFFNSKEKIYKSGMIIYIDGTIELPFKSHYESGFNYYEYLKYNSIYGKINTNEIYIIKKKFSFSNLHEGLNDYINNNFKSPSKEFLKTLIIGDKNTFDDVLYSQIQKLGIAHLFVISGLHMDIIKKFAMKIMNLIKVNNLIQSIIISLLLLVYFVIAMYSVSILRVLLAFIISKISCFNKFNSIDKLSLNASIVLLINPFYLFSFSFLLSYIIVFGILLISPYFKKEKNIKSFILNNLMISFISTIISLPIVIRINSDVNFLSLIYNLFFIPFVSYILLPFSFVTFLVPKLNFIYKYIIKVFKFSIDLLSNINFLTISFSFLNLFFIVIYYLIIILFFNKVLKKYRKVILFVFIVYFAFLILKPYLDASTYVSFVSLPSGEATLIHDSFNKTNILIDTGDIDASELVRYLKLNGINTIHSIIISHGDSDHIGGLKTLTNEFKVNNIFINYYDDVSKKEVLKCNLKKTSVHYIKSGNEFYIGKFYFKVLWPYIDSFDINNNSLVIYANIQNHTFLFTGDIEKEAEEEFIEKVGKINVDILKVAHHCSNTSSHDTFLNNVKFKIAVGMNGYNNKYGFPNKYCIERFNNISNIVLYNTKYTGTVTIRYKYWSKNIKISTSFK